MTNSSSYKVTGDHIDYKDGTGFTADGDFRDGIVYHAGMVLYNQKQGSVTAFKAPGTTFAARFRD